MSGLNPNQKILRAFLANNGDPPGSSGDLSETESVPPSLGSCRSVRSRRSQGTLRNYRGIIRNRRSQIPHSSVRRNIGHESSSPGDSSD